MKNTTEIENNRLLKNAILITDKYYMTADEKQYILIWVKESTSKDNTKTYDNPVNIGYFSSLPSVLKACVSHMIKQGIRNGEITTLKECLEQYMNKLNEFEETFKDIR